MGDFLLQTRVKICIGLAAGSFVSEAAFVFEEASVPEDGARAFFAWALADVERDLPQSQEKCPFGQGRLAFAGAYSWMVAAIEAVVAAKAQTAAALGCRMGSFVVD